MERGCLRKSPEYSEILRYNQETDYIQIYNGTQWVNWKPANLNGINFLLYDVSQWNATISMANYTYQKEDGLLLIKVQYTGSVDNYGTLTLITKTSFSVTGRSVLKIRGSVFSYTTHTPEIDLVDNTGNVLKAYRTPQAAQVWVDMSADVDISNIGGDVYLRINMSNYHNMQPSQLRFSELSII